MILNNDTENKTFRILIVDDEEDIRTIIARGLQREGFAVETSGDPEEVIRNYVQGRYDLLLIDIRMPTINGFQLYKEIRKRDPKVKACFITAFEIYYDEFRRMFPKLQVSCFIRKPVTISRLAEIVREELVRLPPAEAQLTLKEL